MRPAQEFTDRGELYKSHGGTSSSDLESTPVLDLSEVTMSDEFDELTDPYLRRSGGRGVETHDKERHVSPAYLVGRLYRSAEIPLRIKLLKCLTRPLSPLAMVAVAAGAFAGFLGRRDVIPNAISFEEAARFSSEQIQDLARFVEQVNPDVLQEIAKLFADDATGPTAFSAAVAILLLRTIRQGKSARQLLNW